MRLSAQAKGAGMIQPSFATMLCFVQTDAALAPETADLLLGVCVKRSFDRITVDGQLSTNDTVILHGLGRRAASRSRRSPTTSCASARRSTRSCASSRWTSSRDGEGAARVGRVVVRGGHGTRVERAARAVANSPLVKAALHGGDPNWGRIAQAAGMALVGRGAAAARHRDRGHPGLLGRDGRAPRPGGAGRRVSRDPRSSTSSACPGDGHETEVFFSDLSHAYVTINAEYTT